MANENLNRIWHKIMSGNPFPLEELEAEFEGDSGGLSERIQKGIVLIQDKYVCNKNCGIKPGADAKPLDRAEISCIFSVFHVAEDIGVFQHTDSIPSDMDSVSMDGLKEEWESMKEAVAERMRWIKQEDIYFGLYMAFNDDNYNHCEYSFCNQHFTCSSEIMAANERLVRHTLECGMTEEDILGYVPSAECIIRNMREKEAADVAMAEFYKENPESPF